MSLKSQVIMQHTYHLKEHLWMNNFADNLLYVRDHPDEDLKNIEHHPGTAAMIIGAGPSVEKYGQLRLLHDRGFDGSIFVCDKMAKPCLDADIPFDYVVSIDGAPEVAQFFEGVRDHPHYRRAVALMNVATSHPDTSAACMRKALWPVYWFLGMLDDPNEAKSLTRVLHYMSRSFMVQSLGNVGGTAWNLACLLEYSPLVLVGLDFGYSSETRIQDTIYFKEYEEMCCPSTLNPRVQALSQYFREQFKVETPDQLFYMLTNPETKGRVLMDLNWEVYSAIFRLYAEKAHAAMGVQTVNCSPESSLFGPGITYRPLGEVLRLRKDIEVT